MSKLVNIYDYKVSKSENEEIHYLLTKGRITIKTFFIRFIISTIILLINYLIFYNYALPKYYTKLIDGQILDDTFKWTYNVYLIFTFNILPLIIGAFIFIQAVKRLHDINKSGWFFLFPIINFILLFLKGTQGKNDYGLDPRMMKVVTYFDELEYIKQRSKKIDS